MAYLGGSTGINIRKVEFKRFPKKTQPAIKQKITDKSLLAFTGLKKNPNSVVG